MGDESMADETAEEQRGLSRRAALKAGVATGVGVVAWSGMSITSMGGTPAYAAGCTFVTKIDLTSGCRNTDQNSNCPGTFPNRFHALVPPVPSSGFTLVQPPALLDPGVCCPALPADQPSITWNEAVTGDIQCIVLVQYITKNCQASGSTVYRTFFSPHGASPQIPVLQDDGAVGIKIELPCVDITNPGGPDSSSQYQIGVFCGPKNAPEGCITFPSGPPG